MKLNLLKKKFQRWISASEISKLEFEFDDLDYKISTILDTKIYDTQLYYYVGIVRYKDAHYILKNILVLIHEKLHIIIKDYPSFSHHEYTINYIEKRINKIEKRIINIFKKIDIEPLSVIDQESNKNPIELFYAEFEKEKNDFKKSIKSQLIRLHNSINRSRQAFRREFIRIWIPISISFIALIISIWTSIVTTVSMES